ncbi:AI-2E family transporter [Desulfospira joergensenii]|uniref:AI-2E family transporter n=1 Tax=Desulfospira joergensenii TaxID=53329 RepID=UPI0003B3F15C|nr:AI-2E family transporter [Desulfospira joergensenii]
MNRDLIQPSFLLVLVFFISALFLMMIKAFLMAIFLAGIFSALAHPFYRRVNRWMGGRKTLASAATVLVITLIVLLPLSGLLGIVTAQAVKVGQSATPWVQGQLSSPALFSSWLEHLPFYETMEPFQETIFQKAGELAGAASTFFVNGLQAATMGTMNFIFTVSILLYTMFFFLMDGHGLLEKILFYMPLKDNDEQRLLKRFTSVARATIKGTAIIGIIQGGASGIAFAVAGIPSAVFWGAVMTVLSIIPGIGTALIWVPAAFWLASQGAWIKAFLLVLFCGLMVGSVDNFLRPRLVGKDTQMHDLLILFSTLGGISMFGIIGFIIGPIVAALFVTIWDIYGVVFKDVLPKVGPF